MQPSSKRSWLLPLVLAIVSIAVIGASLSLRFLDLDTYKGQIVAQVRSALKRDLRYQSGDFSFRYGPSFTFTDVTIKEKDGVSDFIKADRLTIKIALLPLLRKELVLSRMQLERPVLELSRDRQGVFNLSDLFSQPSSGASATIGGIQLKKAHVRFTDLAVSETPVVTELDDTDLYLSRLTRGKSCDVKFSGSLISKGRKVPLFLAGAAKLPEEGKPWSDCEVTGRVKTGALDSAHFWPYYYKLLPFKTLSGFFGVEGTFKGKLNAFRSKAELTVGRLDLDYPQVFHARLTPKSVKASCEIELKGGNLNFTAVKANVDGLVVNGSCLLSGIHGKDMRITAKANTSKFNLRDFRQFIPYGIIVKDTADFIEQKIMGGHYRLEEGRLDGTVSQILHMEKGTNYNILYVKAHVEDGVVAYGGGFPQVSAIKGELYLSGKDFILKGLTGNFGTSPMALEGRITDYPLDVPCRYLFSASVRARQPEANWAIGSGNKLTLSDGSVAKVNGEGTTALYNISGSWDLGPVSYTFPELISKPKGRPNTLAFRLAFGKEEYRITGLNYQMAPLSLAATGVSRYNGPISFEFRTNQFQAGEIAPLMPMYAPYHPTGKVLAQLHATGPGMDRLSWNGTVALANVSLKAGDKVKPVTGVNGTLKINGETVETPELSVRIGNSPLSGHGTLTGFKKPSVTATFSSPGLDLGDLGFGPGKVPLRAQKVEGTLSYSKEKDYLQIASLSATMGRTQLQVKGVVQELQHPKMELSVTSPHFELADVTPLFGSTGGSGGTRVTMKVHLYATEGKALDVPFQRLRTVAMLEDNILYLQPLEVGVMEGDLSGKVRIDFNSGAPRYQVNCSMQRVSAERMMRFLGAKKQEITGNMSVQADLTAKGETSPELRRTALGAVKLKVEHGSVRKFSTLSKVFSILNVSQLFKGQLPDMVSDGMPYNRITGDFAIRDGIATTSNLFMDSNAINLSAVGKLDLVKEELDLNIGAQPLQTVDKVVSKIPIVGWILTGKDHSLITTYFEARGKIEDPQVKAVPVKSLGKGVLNIFKRVFELPARLITDTGEVLLGR